MTAVAEEVENIRGFTEHWKTHPSEYIENAQGHSGTRSRDWRRESHLPGERSNGENRRWEGVLSGRPRRVGVSADRQRVHCRSCDRAPGREGRAHLGRLLGHGDSYNPRRITAPSCEEFGLWRPPGSSRAIKRLQQERRAYPSVPKFPVHGLRGRRFPCEAHQSLQRRRFYTRSRNGWEI